MKYHNSRRLGISSSSHPWILLNFNGSLSRLDGGVMNWSKLDAVLMESYLSFKWPMTAPLIAFFFFEVCICLVGELGVVGVSIRS